MCYSFSRAENVVFDHLTVAVATVSNSERPPRAERIAEVYQPTVDLRRCRTALLFVAILATRLRWRFVV